MANSRRVLVRSVLTLMIAIVALIESRVPAHASALACGETTLCWPDCSMGPTLCSGQGEGCAAVMCWYMGVCSNYGSYVTIACGAIE